MRSLYADLENAANDVLAVVADRKKVHGPARSVELGLATDDAEARQLGLPCVGAHEALVGLVAARLDRPVKVMPRASTLPTAGAEELRQQAESLLGDYGDEN